MKRIFNIDVKPWLTLPNGWTITPGGPPSDVLNEDILDSPIVKQAIKDGHARIIEEVPEPPKSRPA